MSVQEPIEIIRHSPKSNPIVVVTEERFKEWVRQLANEAGFADHVINAWQFKFGDTLWNGPVDFCFMVSNIKRSAEKP